MWAEGAPLRRRLRWGGLLLGGVCCAIYIGNTWSPSSYAYALRQFEAADDGLVLGRNRLIRSDEWAALTPLTQATVNNGLQRFNHTSYYQEDLRSLYALPVLDWGLLFRPTLWLYPLVNAAYAFSFHHLLVTLLFVAGHLVLF